MILAKLKDGTEKTFDSITLFKASLEFFPDMVQIEMKTPEYLTRKDVIIEVIKPELDINNISIDDFKLRLNHYSQDQLIQFKNSQNSQIRKLASKQLNK